MKEIPLTRGKVALVDDQDFEWLNKFKWRARNIGKKWYAFRTKKLGPGTRKFKNRTMLSMHREILCISDRKLVSDHANGNGLDNRRLNLRSATYSQNNQNRQPQFGQKYIGVRKTRYKNSWKAYINICGKTVSKFFLKEVDAVQWRNQMAIKLNGDFAVLNPLPVEITEPSNCLPPDPRT